MAEKQTLGRRTAPPIRLDTLTDDQVRAVGMLGQDIGDFDLVRAVEWEVRVRRAFALDEDAPAAKPARTKKLVKASK